ncbi:MAG: DUF429 domain-containing protein [Pseudolabrys sp.]
MKQPSKNVWLAGVDGCKGGWVVSYGRLDGETQKPRFARTIDEIVYGGERPWIIAIDVPIVCRRSALSEDEGLNPNSEKSLKEEHQASSAFLRGARSTPDLISS